ncbi:hypothetical protein ACKI1L_38345, partial [Streptomyces scabiei]|uniref:hypothetical protein n=1 Tax=Streptomyces scabiei TaxID=1930 RepID=UPI0038F62562
VTASRADRLVAETPASVQVIERAEIQRQLEFSASPSDALAKLVPGYSRRTRPSPARRRPSAAATCW